jgi:uncharacterized membrane protein
MASRRFHHQSGIALGTIIFIIAVIALLAAVIAAGSGGFNASSSAENTKLAAETIINYADQVSMAVQEVAANRSEVCHNSG